MEKAFIFHGTGANKDSHWFPWIHQKLKQQGFKVCRPNFPTPENQKLENWLDLLDKQEMDIDENTVLIGHSLGAVFILNILNRRNIDIKAAYLVSAWTGTLPDEQFNEWNSTFQDQEFDFEKIKNSAEKIHQFHSASDPYVPLEKAEKLAEDLETNLHLVSNAEHFNTDSGYTEFPKLLKLI